MTQGDPLPPTILNVVVDAVVSHWESLLVAEREGGESSGDKGNGSQMAGRTIQDRDDGKQWTEEGHQCLTVNAALFYANNGVVASTDPGWLQSEFDFMMGLFDQVGLHTNVRKTVGMVFRTCQAAGVRAEKAYTRRMTGEGSSFKVRQQERVICL